MKKPEGITFIFKIWGNRNALVLDKNMRDDNCTIFTMIKIFLLKLFLGGTNKVK